MDKEKIRAWAGEIEVLAQNIRTELDVPDEIPTPNPVPVPVDQLQAALDIGGDILLVSAGEYAASAGYKVYSNTYVTGQTARISAVTSAALRVPPTHGFIALVDLVCDSQWTDCAILLGANDSNQTDPAVEPHDINLERVVVRSHRGKRALYLCARDVLVQHCLFTDVLAPNNQDSQAICILNSSGTIRIFDSILEAASESLIVGGDTMKMPGHPQNIIVKGCTIRKRMEWKGNITSIKNLLELKDGWGVTIEDCLLENCWAAAQQGEAFMFTPKSGGQVDVRVINCEVRNVSRIVNITGKDNSALANQTRTKVQFVRGNYQTNKVQMGGDGRFCLITGGPESVIFRGIYARAEGTAFIDTDSAHIDYLELTDSDVNFGSYGIRIGGYNHGDNSHGVIGAIRIENNRITGASSAFRTRYPNNTYL